MDDFQEPQNLCGRYILYPHFGSLRRDINIILPPPEDPHPYPPPGARVRPSVCQTYYSSKDPQQMSNSCKKCIYNEYDISRAPISGTDPANKNTCICGLKRDFSPDDFCDYASCVQTNNKLNGSCLRPFNAIFNVDDVRDANYMSPFTYEQIQYCQSRK